MTDSELRTRAYRTARWWLDRHAPRDCPDFGGPRSTGRSPQAEALIKDLAVCLAGQPWSPRIDDEEHMQMVYVVALQAIAAHYYHYVMPGN